MAKRKPAPPPPITGKPLSELAKYLLMVHGAGRLKLVREEHRAGLPHTMSQRERELRIEALCELIDR